MKFKNGPEIALAVKEIDEVANFFQDIFGIEAKKGGDDYYKIETEHYKLFPVKSEIEFTMVLELFVENVEEAQKYCIDAGCKIIRWNERDHWLQHPSGFSFHLEEQKK